MRFLLESDPRPPILVTPDFEHTVKRYPVS